MRFKYSSLYLYDEEDNSFKVKIINENEGLLLKDILNTLSSQVKYQKRVIDKCIRNEKKYNNIIEDKDDLINLLENEKDILKKIIKDEEII